MKVKKGIIFSLFGIAFCFNFFAGKANELKKPEAAEAYFSADKTIYIRNDGGQYGGWLTDNAKLKVNYQDNDYNWHSDFLNSIANISNSSDYIFEYTFPYNAINLQILRFNSNGSEQWNYSNRIELNGVTTNLFSINSNISNDWGFSTSSASINRLTIGESKNGSLTIYAGDTMNVMPEKSLVYSTHWFRIEPTPNPGYYLSEYISNSDSVPKLDTHMLEGTSGDTTIQGIFFQERNILIGDSTVLTKYTESNKEFSGERVFIEEGQVLKGKYRDNVFYDLFVEDHDSEFICNQDGKAVCLQTGYYNLYLKSNDGGSNYPNVYIASADLIDAHRFASEALLMDSYDTELTGVGNGTCYAYYKYVQKGWNMMSEYGQKLFEERPEFADARARYEAWTKFNTTNPSGMSYNGIGNFFEGEDDSAILITVTTMVASSALLGVYIIKRKKHQ